MLGGLVLSLYSCSKEYEAVSNNGNTEKGVYFSSSIAGGYNTKAQYTMEPERFYWYFYV
jgi:endonuclease G